MHLISNRIEPKKTGKNGMNNQIYQPFYSISEEDISRPGGMSLSAGPSNGHSYGYIHNKYIYSQSGNECPPNGNIGNELDPEPF